MSRKRNQTALSDSSSEPSALTTTNAQNKKLRRLPHVFGKVLELPFNADTDVRIEERADCFCFVAKTDSDLGRVRVHIVRVHPGLKRAVIRRIDGNLEMLIDDLDLNVWRFRLPAVAQLELTKAVYGGGQLVVTVPKNGGSENEWRVCRSGITGGMGNLVLVNG
ncbi:hypothetical protein Nepgr_010276 [Nepenthes gracilis]|uniref:Uncharacterized protein n=1 Tax=Nepenthes gracilis TaxID=150966 RepID=A0AAD3SCV1_NEPGR|nr:hypothetical protein Nepgr_010276 [Nepenthes gracilis]